MTKIGELEVARGRKEDGRDFHRSVLKEVERKTHKKIDNGAVNERDLWFIIPKQPKIVAAAVDLLEKEGCLLTKDGHMLLARYLGWSRDERFQFAKKPKTEREIKIQAITAAIRRTALFAGVVSKFHNVCIANEETVAKAVLDAIEQRK